MKELLTSYSIMEILVFGIILFIAIRELVTYIDWGKNRMKQYFDKDYKSHETIEEITGKIDKLFEEKEKVDGRIGNINDTFAELKSVIDMLVSSDKEDIKSYITREHHYFCYEKGWIDDYSMECLEKRFAIYEQEHGNSFVEGLMNEIRALPKTPPEDLREKLSSTSEYVKQSHERKRKQ